MCLQEFANPPSNGRLLENAAQYLHLFPYALFLAKELRAVLFEIGRLSASQQDVLPLSHLFPEVYLHLPYQLQLAPERRKHLLVTLAACLHPGQDQPDTHHRNERA